MSKTVKNFSDVKHSTEQIIQNYNYSYYNYDKNKKRGRPEIGTQETKNPAR